MLACAPFCTTNSFNGFELLNKAVTSLCSHPTSVDKWGCLSNSSNGLAQKYFKYTFCAQCLSPSDTLYGFPSMNKATTLHMAFPNYYWLTFPGAAKGMGLQTQNIAFFASMLFEHIVLNTHNRNILYKCICIRGWGYTTVTCVSLPIVIAWVTCLTLIS